MAEAEPAPEVAEQAAEPAPEAAEQARARSLSRRVYTVCVVPLYQITRGAVSTGRSAECMEMMAAARLQVKKLEF